MPSPYPVSHAGKEADDGLREALVKARAIVVEYIDDCGGCDHEVGICMCSEYAVLEQIDAALAARSADKADV